MRFPVIPLFLLALPFLEIAGFVVVGRQIGVFWTLALVIAAGMAGLIVLRVQGFGIMARIRAEADAGRDPGRQLANGVMILFAGVLLVVPGFVTDILALLLFLPPVRSFAWRFLKRRIVVASAGFGGFQRPGAQSRDKSIDLDPGEYSETPRPDSPWRTIDRN
ncbi:MAG: membrane protein FxsA [Hyphomicrobiales bacterium]|nr:membrane protein FxsA [Hyphomicrobiales bacterium]